MQTKSEYMAELIEIHKLDRTKDWQTIQLALEILRNYNQSSVINLYPNQFLGANESWAEPEPLDIMIPKFKALFEQGYSILFSKTSCQGDDGGSLYLCYLLKPEYEEQYNRQFDREVCSIDAKSPGFFHDMQYLITNPSHFIEIWAGAY